MAIETATIESTTVFLKMCPDSTAASEDSKCLFAEETEREFSYATAKQDANDDDEDEEDKDEDEEDLEDDEEDLEDDEEDEDEYEDDDEEDDEEDGEDDEEDDEDELRVSSFRSAVLSLA